MKIIVGLGNPGARYAGTRHNVGFAVVDAVADRCRAKAARRSHRALVAQAVVGGEGALLVKPQTYMNLSGEAVAAILRDTGAGPGDLIVVHDDLDMPLGRIRIRKSGGAGGHNGIASIIAVIETGSFLRVKFGIGRPPEGMDPADYVLSPFSGDETQAVRDSVRLAMEAVLAIVREGPDRAMNYFNKNTEPPE